MRLTALPIVLLMARRIARLTRHWLSRAGALGIACVFYLSIAWLSVASAQTVSVANVVAAKVDSNEEGYQLNADFDLQLSPTMIEAVRKGVALHFVVEFEISKGRWYWLDEVMVRASRTRRLSYAPLTDQYRITSAGISQNVSTVEEVQRSLSRVRSWSIADKGRFKLDEKYEAQIRLRLDTSQLPKPFQVNALGNKDWSLTSDWLRFSFTAEKP